MADVKYATPSWSNNGGFSTSLLSRLTERAASTRNCKETFLRSYICPASMLCRYTVVALSAQINATGSTIHVGGGTREARDPHNPCITWSVATTVIRDNHIGRPYSMIAKYNPR